MTKIGEKIFGIKSEKRAWREAMRRAKKLPKDYRAAFISIKKYIFSSSGMMESGVEIWQNLVDLLEQAAAENRPVKNVIGGDVAAFADELVKGQKTWQDKQRQKLNRKIAEI
ncbi:MAG: DUF1048 domain-containing protein [Candidatus Nomurabacteria bacterium]|nr:DUF1048 domain-containing protein [Candidatus Nomurabacteria bacterium]